MSDAAPGPEYTTLMLLVYSFAQRLRDPANGRWPMRSIAASERRKVGRPNKRSRSSMPCIVRPRDDLPCYSKSTINPQHTISSRSAPPMLVLAAYRTYPFSQTYSNLFTSQQTCSRLSFCFVESSFTSSCTLQQTSPELLSPQTATEELPAGASPLLNRYPGFINLSDTKTPLDFTESAYVRTRTPYQVFKERAPSLVFARGASMIPRADLVQKEQECSR
jgi:hypothetical protein